MSELVHTVGRPLSLLLGVAASVFLLIKLFRFKQEHKTFVEKVSDIPAPNAGIKEMFPKGMDDRVDFLKRTLYYARVFKDHPFFAWWPLPRSLPISHPVVVVNSPEAAQEILSLKQLPAFHKGRAYQISMPLIGRGLLNSEGEYWRFQRKVVEPGFRFNFLRRLVPTVKDLAAKLGDRWSRLPPTEVFDMHTEMLRITADAIGLMAFEYDFGGILADQPEDAPLFKAFQTVLTTLNRRLNRNPLAAPFLNNLPTAENRAFNAAMKKLEDCVEEMLRRKQRKVQELAERGEESVDHDLLTQLLQPGDDGRTLLTEQEIKDNVKTFLFAGHDTTASALTWAFYLASTNPEFEERLIQEINDTVGPNTELTFELIEGMPLLNAFVKEVLRLYPSAGFMRVATQDMVVAGQLIPKGTEILFYPTIMHTDPRYWPNPWKFDPDRWLGERGKLINMSAYMPFSAGPRSCVGNRMALTEMRVILAYLLPRFRLRHHGEMPAVDIDLTLFPVNVRMSVMPRKEDDYDQWEPVRPSSSASQSNAAEAPVVIGVPEQRGGGCCCLGGRCAPSCR